MKIGFIGSGNMARAIALGLREPATFSDSGSGRAAELARLTGGTAARPINVGAEAELLFLCHKPAQLTAIAEGLGEFSGVLISVLAATSLQSLRDAYPNAKVLRIMPNTPVEFNAGVVCLAAESDDSAKADELLARLGDLVRLPEAEFEVATAVGGCAPAFFALFAQALRDEAITRGMASETANRIVGKTLSGTAALLDGNQMDTETAIRAVASPGGLTEKALQSFDESDLAGAVKRAVATVLGESV